MTTPAPSQQMPKPRTWRPMAAWTAGILLALGLAWFVGAMVLPVWQVRTILMDKGNYQMGSLNVDVARLGGKESSARTLSIYMQLPDKLAPRKRWCVRLLEECGDYGVPAIKKALRSSDIYARLEAGDWLVFNGDEHARDLVARMLVDAAKERDVWVRYEVMCVVGHFRTPHERLLPVLVSLLDDDREIDISFNLPYMRMTTIRALALNELGKYGAQARPLIPRIGKLLDSASGLDRAAAAAALGSFGPAARESIPALERLLKDNDPDVRAAAAEALKKIRGEGPPK
jgi:hypothetical protein